MSSALASAIDSIAGTKQWIELPVRSTETATPPDERMRDNHAAIVSVTSWWHLVDSASGRPVFQRWVAAPDVDGGRPHPALVSDSIENRSPLLSLESDDRLPIGAMHRGVGVIVRSTGLILTSGDLLNGWRLPFDGSRDGETAILTDSSGRVKRDSTGATKTGYTRVSWQPQRGGPGVPHVRGVLDSINVELSGGQRLPARIVAVTPDIAVASLEISMPRRLPTVDLLGDLLLPGEPLWMTATVGGAIQRRQGVGEENRLERYLWIPTTPDAVSEELALGTPFFDSRGRLAGLKVSPLLGVEYPERSDRVPVAALRSLSVWIAHQQSR
jgi:hypothetical protein